MKKLIINADDLGASENNNIAIKKGYEAGIITSSSLIVNMDGFEHAVKEIIPSSPQLDTGIHLNIMEGKSISDCPQLTDSCGNFSLSYPELILKSYDKKFMTEVEKEFKAQIEKALNYHKITHIDSHIHTHAIPEIFKLTVKIASEYGIKYIRTQQEIPYIVKNKILTSKFPVNVVKNLLLNSFTSINLTYLKKFDIKTNDYFIGVLYTGNMDENTIIKALEKIKNDTSLTEVIFHPYYCENVSKEKQNNYKEFLITQNPKFKEYLKNSGSCLTNYSV